jgi:energy-coupling factor transporter ATP-binding protein EcfA2
MLTRLIVSGFKNLVDVDVRFGPFTCVAGANGVGKSNLFDAIKFLSAIAERPLIDAALSVRDERGRTSDVRSLFHRIGDDYASQMSFEAEMIVPYEGVDDLGQKATASITFLRYSITLAYRADDDSLRSLGPLEILKEELSHINLGDANKHLLFNSLAPIGANPQYRDDGHHHLSQLGITRKAIESLSYTKMVVKADLCLG